MSIQNLLATTVTYLKLIGHLQFGRTRPRWERVLDRMANPRMKTRIIGECVYQSFATKSGEFLYTLLMKLEIFRRKMGAMEAAWNDSSQKTVRTVYCIVYCIDSGLVHGEIISNCLL